MIIFENQGEIDPQVVTLIGVNIKNSPSAIGFFGTGLKYAVACLARWGETLEIHSGLAKFVFSAETREVRGTQFQVPIMVGPHDRVTLGFTTDLGKQWEPWMVYRELWSNAKDEPGSRVYETSEVPRPQPGITRVVVDGPKMAVVHGTRGKFLLEDPGEPLAKTDGLEIYESTGNEIFYRGIKVQDLPKPSLYTYNIIERIWLTEDRTAGSWTTNPVIARGITECVNQEVIENTLRASQEVFESGLDYGGIYNPGTDWALAAKALVEKEPLVVPASVRAKYMVKEEAARCTTCGQRLPEVASESPI